MESFGREFTQPLSCFRFLGAHMSRLREVCPFPPEFFAIRNTNRPPRENLVLLAS
jgi:hypothetical protein